MNTIRAIKGMVDRLMAYLSGIGGWWALQYGLRVGDRSRIAGEVILIAAPGGGNLGDQAMLETFLDQTQGLPRAVVTPSRTTITMGQELGAGMTVIELPQLTHGMGLGHLRDISRLGRRLSSASQVCLIGADVMDGAYSAHASATRWRILIAAAEMGIPARVLGFSWNSNPSRGAVKQMSRASSAGVTMCARDPHSAERLRKDGSRTVLDVTDIVFLLGRNSDDAPQVDIVERLRISRGKLAVVNASGLVGSKKDQVPAYKAAVEWLIDRGYGVVMLPHVNRGARGDIWANSEVIRSIDREEKPLALDLLWPAAIRSITRRADLVITGRMHLAIMSLANGTPPVVVATQGKVLGLLALFGLEHLCVEPDDAFTSSLLTAVKSVDAENAGARASIATALPSVKALARANFDFISPAPEES